MFYGLAVENESGYIKKHKQNLFSGVLSDWGCFVPLPSPRPLKGFVFSNACNNMLIKEKRLCSNGGEFKRFSGALL